MSTTRPNDTARGANRHTVHWMLALCGSLPLLTGCPQNEPLPPYNYDLGEEGTVLLPTAGSVHGAHDARIMQSATADLFRRGDVPAPIVPASRSITPAEVSLEPASSVGEAFGNVGKAFMANLLSGKNADNAAMSTTAEAPESTGVLSAADEAAIGQLVATFNEALAQRNFRSIPPLCVERQQATATLMFEAFDEMNASITALAGAFEASSPGGQAQVDAVLANATAPLESAGLRSTGPDAAQGELKRGSGAPLAVSFERENGKWLLVHPQVPEREDWPTMENDVRIVIDRLDELSGSGSPAEADVLAAVQQAVNLLFGSSGA